MDLSKFKTLAGGAALGAVGLAIFGFGFAGWKLESKANDMVDTAVRAAVVETLAPFCVQKALADPELQVRIAALEEQSFWNRGDALVDFGWASLPGYKSPVSGLPGECYTDLDAELERLKTAKAK